MVEEGLSLLESCWTDKTLELLHRGQEVGGRISAGVEAGHHVGQSRGGHREEPGTGEVEIKTKVWMLELLRGHSCCLGLVLVAVSGVEEVKEGGAVGSKLLLLLLLLLLLSSLFGHRLLHSSSHLTWLRPRHFLRALFHYTGKFTFEDILVSLLTSRDGRALSLCLPLPRPLCSSLGRTLVRR